MPRPALQIHRLSSLTRRLEAPGDAARRREWHWPRPDIIQAGSTAAGILEQRSEISIDMHDGKINFVSRVALSRVSRRMRVLVLVTNVRAGVKLHRGIYARTLAKELARG